MVQDTREYIAATLLALSLLTERTMQHEADKDTDVPFARYELRAVQEDGNICMYTQMFHIDATLTVPSVRNLPLNAR